MKVVIIGNGIIGSEIAKKMREKDKDEIYTIDINPKTKPDFESLSDFYKHHDGDVYIICVWTQKQVREIINEISFNNHPLISLETACELGTYALVKGIVGIKADLVVFQERIYPNDDFHSIFNHPRVMGGDYKRGREFYLRYMIWENIIVTDYPEIAELCKVAENAYRYVEIALAQELKMMTGNRFDELRRLMNTKWNINVKEARGGIGGVCLNKDLKILNNSYDNVIFKAAEKSNKEYIGD